jgi:hypothetical protein
MQARGLGSDLGIHRLSLEHGARESACATASVKLPSHRPAVSTATSRRFPNDEFPAQLGAVVMKAVLDGGRPALHVAHFPDGEWAIGDGEDPNVPCSCIATHIWHAIERNSSIRALASMPPGRAAHREAPGSPWIVSEWRPED